MSTLAVPIAPANANAPAAPRVLVLDDNAMITDMLGSMLEMFGYHATLANAGCEALHLLQRDHFDVVLSDMRMPRMDGQEFYQRAVADHPELAHRIIFLTGDSVGDGAREFLERTACPHLTKPYTLQNLQSVVENMLHEQTIAA